MARLIAARFAGLAATLFAVSILVFLVMNLLPGDPAAIMLGTSARPDTLAALRIELGLDQPLALRYLRWIGGILSGDFGTSTTYGVPVAGLIADRLALTIPLASMALFLSLLVALPLGILSAAHRGGFVDLVATLLSQIGLALPNFWIGLILILVFATTLGLMPSGGFPGWSAGLFPCLTALVMPATALALPQAAVLTRVTRAAVLDVMNQDFVRTARAKGLPRNRALYRHAVPNALIPVVTILGMQVSVLMAGAVLVENVFGLPGLGRLAYQALAQRDLVVIEDVVLMFAAIVICVNFLVDLAYLALDPRLRTVRHAL